MHHADRGGICIKYTIFRLILVANRKRERRSYNSPKALHYNFNR